ncbi:hypothetical protein D3C71_267070 [compost metagenome]
MLSPPPPPSSPTILGTVTADDAPLPSTRSVDEALVMLSEMERGALSVLTREGLPDVPGLYRRDAPGAPWSLLPRPATVEDRWQEILDRPPDAGFHYLKLSDVARAERPGVAEVQSAAAVLDRTDDLRALLTRPGEEEAQNDALLMFWSTVELMIVLFAGDRDKDPIRVNARRALEWETWRREALRIWEASPGLSLRSTAKLVVERLGLSESHHSVRRRLSGHQPAA